MSSAFGGLNTVVRGLNAQQVSLDTVGHNVANANTEGYSRQSVNLVTVRPQSIYGANGEVQIGTGVNVQSITRARNTYVDRQMWKELSNQGYGSATTDILTQVEGAFNEPSETGIQTVLNQFWSSFQSLSTNASDNGVRTTVRQRGVELVNAITAASNKLTSSVVDANAVIDVKVDSVNQLSSEIYSLNKQITNIEAGGTDHANDLRDRRDSLVDKMSKMINITLSEDKSGNYNIQTNGIPLVDGTTFSKLTTKPSAIDSQYGYEVKNVMLEGTNQPVQLQSGEIKGLIDSRDSADYGIKGYLNKLNSMCKFLLQDFNNVQKAGYGTDNSTGINFFGEAGTNYNSWTPSGQSLGWIAQMKVNPQLFDANSGLSKIAAKTSINNLTIQQSNVMGGSATVKSTYTGTTPIKYVVRIDGVGMATSGNVTQLSYSSDDGKTWASATGTGSPLTFTLLNSATMGTVSVSISSDSDNAVGDKYTFSSSQGNAAGDNAVLLANKLKNDMSETLGGSTLDTFYSSLIGGLGVQVQDAKRLTENQDTLVSQITTWRESTAGVNMDEEMANMIKFQKGYNAAGRVVTAMDEMLDKLINSTGVVGR